LKDINSDVVKVSDVSQNYEFKIPGLRTVCIPRRTCFAYFTYAPLVAFILNMVVLPGHLILLPYYFIVILSRGRPPKALYYWVYFNSAFLYGAIHEKEEVWRDFGSLYYIFIGNFIAFGNWILTTVSLGLIFPVFIYIEEWRLLTNVIYRLTFGNWKRIVNECPEMRYNNGVKKQQDEDRKRKHKETIRKSKMHDVKIVDVDEELESKKTTSICQTCGEKIDTETSYCPKCGSYIGH